MPGRRADDYVNVVWDSSALKRQFEVFDRKVLAAAKQSVSEITRQAEQALEDATRSAVGGNLWRAWTSKVYPKGAKLAKTPRGEVFVRGRKTGKGQPRTYVDPRDRSRGAVTAYAEGATIRGRRGQFLAIPLPQAGRRFTGRDKVALTPEEWERRTGRKLRLVWRSNRSSLLVADDVVVAKNGRGVRAASKRRIAQGREAISVPIFVLVRQVDVPKRFSIGRTLDPFEMRLAARFRALVREIGELNGQ